MEARFFSCFCLALYFAGFQAVLGEASWAKEGNLLGFWPLSNYHKLTDISGNSQNGAVLQESASSTQGGPFGDPLTSYGSPSTRPYGGIFDVKSPKTAQKLSLKGLDSFTVSFFLNPAPGDCKGGLLQFLMTDYSSGIYPFALYIDNGNICMYGANSGCSNITDVINCNTWQYLAMRFVADGKGVEPNCSVSLFSRYGQIMKARVHPVICKAQSYSQGGIRLGGTAVGSGVWNPNFRVSCLMIYNTALTEADVLQNYQACRTIHSAPPCGTPRLPLPQPQIPTVAARAGQFPWVASLRFKINDKMACSATIINGYWLLTAASCFSASSQPSNYYVNVAEYDLATTESYEQKHMVRSIVFKQTSYQELFDIALIELLSPIDFGNAYVNEACIPEEDSFFQPTTTSFVVGWGENGRQSSSSQTVIRYATGSVVPNETCAASWSVDKPQAEPLLCFLGAPEAKVPCMGDAGSPLGFPVGSKLVQVGIYSTRNTNCSSTTTKLPLFTRVVKFWPWIKSVIACVNPGKNYPLECPMP